MVFILVDDPVTSKLEYMEICYYIYYKTYIFGKIGTWCFFVILIAMFVIKKTGFKIGQQKISPLKITVTLHF